MENDDWEGYFDSEYHEAMVMRKPASKKKAPKKSIKEMEEDIRRELERKEQEREQELLVNIHPRS